MVKFGPTGEDVYNRTYRRVKSDGTNETLHDTVVRVVDGNLGLVDKKFQEKNERERLIYLMENFYILPGGRHWWMSGVPGRQFLFNCHHAGWGENIQDHFTFTFDQLMQGGGVGANYSDRFIKKYKPVKHEVAVHIVCDPDHADYEELLPYVSDQYSHLWAGCIRVDDSREGWYDALAALLDAFWNGIDTLVFDLSLIRRRGLPIKTFGGIAAGPMPLAKLLVEVSELLSKRVGQKITSLDAMLIDHYIGECVVSGNVRRSARMSIKSWKDEDIFDFIKCKRDKQAHWSTNISVEIDDAFFRALKRGDDHATKVYHEAVKGMLTDGEPGFYNITLASVGEVEEVASTNPCGEIPLNQWENCNLGHVNLDAYHDDVAGAKEAHRLMTRFLIRATFGDVPNPRQRAVLDKNRRIGVGHLGFQGWLVKQGIRFSDSHMNQGVRKILKEFYNVCRQEARDYSFLLRIPEPIKVTTVAPTGTIAKMPGVSEGIHPIYGRYFVRRIRYADNAVELDKFRLEGRTIEKDLYSPNTVCVLFPTKDILVEEVEKLGLDAEYLVEAANEINFADMLAVQAMYQECYADNAISFTVNVEPGTPTVEDAKKTLINYLSRLKGTTIMVDGSRPQSPYERITKEEYEGLTGGFVGDGINEECANGACPIR